MDVLSGHTDTQAYSASLFSHREVPLDPCANSSMIPTMSSALRD